MIKKRLIVIVLAALLLTTAAFAVTKTAAYAEGEKYNAKSALLMDYNTGEVLYSQNADARLPIASMVKIMTLNLIFEEIDKGSLKLDDQIPVSPNAAGMGGSQAFLSENVKYSANELIKSIIVASANDSCVAMAEHIAGDIESFVSRMNGKAAEWKMTNTKFANCTGLPAPDNYSCASDVAIMFRNLITHKQFFEYSKVWMYDFAHPEGRITTLTNTNKLVRFYNGCDGGKTGFTKEALSCLAATAQRGDTRLIGVIIAAPEAKERNAEVSKLLNFGFANFETKKVISRDMQLDSAAAKVDGGKEDNVAFVPEKDYFSLTKKGQKSELSYQINVETVKAPINKGDVVGQIDIMKGGAKIADVNLIASADVKKVGYLDIINKMIKEW